MSVRRSVPKKSPNGAAPISRSPPTPFKFIPVKSTPSSSPTTLSPAIIANRSSLAVRSTKHWARRTELWSLYNRGVQMDTALWHTAAPEWLAAEQARHLRRSLGVGDGGAEVSIIDAFAGAGSHAIQFALAGMRVVAIERDPVRLAMGRHNAAIYGVHDRITFVLGDFTEMASVLQADAVFLGPPWRGISGVDGGQQQNAARFDIEQNQSPYSATALYTAAAIVAPNITMYMPRSTRREQVHDLAAHFRTPYCTQWYTDRNGGNCPGLTAYFGRRLTTDPARALWRSKTTIAVTTPTTTATKSTGTSPVARRETVVGKKQPQPQQQKQQQQQQREVAIGPVQLRRRRKSMSGGNSGNSSSDDDVCISASLARKLSLYPRESPLARVLCM